MAIDDDDVERLAFAIRELEKHVLRIDSRSIDTNSRIKRIEHFVNDIERYCFLFLLSGLAVLFYLLVRFLYNLPIKTL